MCAKIGFIFILSIYLFGFKIRADDCYSCISQNIQNESWLKNVSESLRRLEQRVKPTIREDCHDDSADLPKVLCRSKCAKETLVTADKLYVVRYCMDTQSLPYNTNRDYELRHVTVNQGLGDRRPETCQKVDRENGTICICRGHLCNEVGLRTVSSWTFLTSVFTIFPAIAHYL